MKRQIILIFVILFIFSEKENKVYEKYLSEELVGQIGRISHSSLYNLGILQDVIASGILTKAQAVELRFAFRDIAFETQDVSEMGDNTGLLQNYSHNNVVSINNEYHLFFINLEMDSDEIELTDKQITVIKKMGKLMQAYRNVVKNTLEKTGDIGEKGVPNEFKELYHHKGITDDYWKNVLKEYERVTDLSYRL